MGLFRGAVSRLGVVLGTAALLSAAGCGTEEVQVQPVPMLTRAPARSTVQVKVLADEGPTENGRRFSFGVSDPEACRTAAQWQDVASEVCARHAGTLLETSVLSTEGCGEGGLRSLSVTCEGPLAPEPTSDAYSYTGILGGADQCRPSADWAQLAAAFCGPHEQAVQVTPERGCGEGQTRYARVTCRNPLPTLPPPSACTLKSLSGVCTLPEHWSELAERHCAETGQALGEVAVAPGRTCGDGGFDFAWVTCCGPEVPPEPTEECFGVAIGGPPSACQSAEAWEAQAQGYCGSQDATLRSSIPLTPCGQDTFAYTSVTCCR